MGFVSGAALPYEYRVFQEVMLMVNGLVVLSQSAQLVVEWRLNAARERFLKGAAG